MARPVQHGKVVLALLLSLQWVTAFAHCLAPLGLVPLAVGAGGHAVEICSAEGIRTVLLGEEGQPEAPTPQRHDSCPLCPGSAAPGPEAPAVAALPVRYIAAAPALPRAGLPPAPARAPPQQPCAPPIA